jgi:hypothetical protein
MLSASPNESMEECSPSKDSVMVLLKKAGDKSFVMILFGDHRSLGDDARAVSGIYSFFPSFTTSSSRPNEPSKVMQECRFPASFGRTSVSRTFNQAAEKQEHGTDPNILPATVLPSTYLCSEEPRKALRTATVMWILSPNAL